MPTPHQLPPRQTFEHPFTGQVVEYNCVIGMQGRATLCLIDEQGMRWGDVWLDELPEAVAHGLLALNVHQSPAKLPIMQWYKNVAIWLLGVALMAAVFTYFK
jgi:hypothetical protein